MLGPWIVCPLWLAGDRRTAVDGVDADHRCHAVNPAGADRPCPPGGAVPVRGARQCERYLAYLARTPASRPADPDPVGGRLVSHTPAVVDPEPRAWRGMARRAWA